MANFKERLIELQVKNKLLKKDMAEIAGVTYRGWQYIENGTKEPAISKVVALAEYFNVSLDYLVGRTDNPKVNR